MEIGAHCMNLYIMYMIQKHNTYRELRLTRIIVLRSQHLPVGRKSAQVIDIMADAAHASAMPSVTVAAMRVLLRVERHLLVHTGASIDNPTCAHSLCR